VFAFGIGPSLREADDTVQCNCHEDRSNDQYIPPSSICGCGVLHKRFPTSPYSGEETDSRCLHLNVFPWWTRKGGPRFIFRGFSIAKFSMFQMQRERVDPDKTSCY
jgi:hypothetical protein